MAEGDSLGDRMKNSYEQVSDNSLTRRIPVICRLDGSCFHSWTTGLGRPFDDGLRACMEYATYRLCKEIEGARFAYTQSDEVSVLIVDYQTIKTEPWFGYRLSKMLSVPASICTSAFTTAAMKYLPEQLIKKGMPKFDARVFSIPQEEVANYFLWRQQDSVRNSIQMIARENFSQKQLHEKSCDEIQDMLFKEKGINWNDTPTRYKRGVSFYKVETEWIVPVKDKNETIIRKKWVKDYEMPVITQDFNYVNKWVAPEPEYTKITESDRPTLSFCEDIIITTPTSTTFPEGSLGLVAV